MEGDNQFVSEKKRKRMASKQRKAEAFLALVGSSSKQEDNRLNSIMQQSSDESLKSTNFYHDEHTSNSKDQVYSSQAEESNNSGYSASKSLDPAEEMRAIIRERKKASMQKPKVFLTPEEMVAFRPFPLEPISDDEVPPLFVMDLQQLLLHGIQGNMASYKPRWCKVLRIGRVTSVVLLTVDGISYDDYMQYKEHFPHLSNSFDIIVEMVNPQQYGHAMEEELLKVPLSISQLKKVNVKVPPPIQKQVVEKLSEPLSDPGVHKFPLKCLLLSTYQMMQEGYPLPIQTNQKKYQDFVFTKDRYKKVTENSPMFAVDCEMCLTNIGRSELTRVSVVSQDGTVIYDTLVQPRNKIINYLTKYSGITQKMLDPVTTRIEDVQQMFNKLLPPDAILCGQSLNSDLSALKMFHPYVIDTSIIFNMSGNRKVKAGLRKLTQFFLGRTIQNRPTGHCSTEDATATLDLVKLKLSKSLEFGDATLNGIYFPDIHTYFMGSKDGSSQASENVEKETQAHSSATTNSVSTEQQKQDSSRTVSETCNQHCGQPANVRQNGLSPRLCDGLSKPSASSSSSSSSEDDEDTSAVSSPKRRKVDKNDNAMSESKTLLPQGTGIPDTTNDSQTSLDGQGAHEVGVSSILSTTKFARIQQENIFNQHTSMHIPHSFFQLTKEAGRTACVVGTLEDLACFETEPLEKLITSSNSEVRHETKQLVQKKQFVYAQFSGPNMEADDAKNVQKSLRKLDRQLRSVLRKIPPNSLVLTVFKGRNCDGGPHNMATFVKTT